MDATEKLIMWAFGALAAFVVVSICFLIVAIDHLESWREKSSAKHSKE